MQTAIFVMFDSSNKIRKAKSNKKHKTTAQKKVHCNKIKENYLNMQPAKKKSNAVQKHKSLDTLKKGKIY
jgi:peroxiredoxin family protein